MKKQPLLLALSLLVATLLGTVSGHAAKPTVWIIGDSTVRNGQKEMVGWGEEIGKFFNDKVEVQNHAIGGRSSRTFINEGRWQKVLDQIKKDDYLLVQFGHNDVGPIDERGKFRGSLKGTGDETEKVKKPDGSEEEVHTFGFYMRQYASEAKEKGATVVILSPVPHKAWDGKRLKDDFGDYRKWGKDAAQKTGVLFVDLTDIVTDAYNKEGPEKVEAFFADPRTHTSREGAEFNARCVIAGLKGLAGQPFDKYFSKDAAEIQPAK